MKVKNYHKFPYDASTARLIRRFMILLNLKVLFLRYYKKKINVSMYSVSKYISNLFGCFIGLAVYSL